MIPCFGGYWGQGQDIGGDCGSDTDWGHTLATKQMLSDRPGVLYRLHRDQSRAHSHRPTSYLMSWKT